MVVDVERILQKIAYIRAQVSAVEELVKTSERQAILSDPWKLKGVKYSLQTAIEALIDITYHVIAKMSIGAANRLNPDHHQYKT